MIFYLKSLIKAVVVFSLFHQTSNAAPNFFLTPLQLKNITPLHQLIIKEKIRLKKHLPWLDGVKSINDTKKFIEESQKEKSNAWRYTICLGDSERKKSQIETDLAIVGVVSIENLFKTPDSEENFANHNEKEIPEIGCWIGEKWEGKGVMFRSVVSLLNKFFNETNFQYIAIKSGVNNYRSNKLAQNLGFTFVETLKKAENLYGEWIDINLYFLSKEDFLKIKQMQNSDLIYEVEET